MFKGTGLLYSVGVGEFMIIWGGSVIGGIGVAEVPQVGLASANSTTCNPTDKIRIVVKVNANTLFATSAPIFQSR